jgi:hypothetical protein
MARLLDGAEWTGPTEDVARGLLTTMGFEDNSPNDVSYS